MILAELLRKGRLRVKYDKKYNEQWSDEELFKHITELYCSHNDLTKLPDLPICEKLYCHGNCLTQLPELPECLILHCDNNLITNIPNLPRCHTLNCSLNKIDHLPKLPLCKRLYCNNNQLIQLPDLPNCEVLDCSSNNLKQLPELPYCQTLDCWNNKLPFTSLKLFQGLWKFKNFYLSLKYVRIMYKRMLTIKKNKRKELHLELKYSPNLRFYKEDEYYIHFVDTLKLFS